MAKKSVKSYNPFKSVMQTKRREKRTDAGTISQNGELYRMIDLDKIYIYRMTHIDNIAHILSNGITHKDSKNSNPDYIPIGDPSIISTRNNKALNNEKSLGDYIPFYFGLRMPMLFVIQKGYNNVEITHAENIVYCVSSIQKIIDAKLDFVFTDGHANDFLSEEYNHSDIKNIDEIIDWEAVNSKFWTDGDNDKKRRMEAEFLVLGDIPTNAIIGYGVYNKQAKDKLLKLKIAERIIQVNKNFYF